MLTMNLMSATMISVENAVTVVRVAEARVVEALVAAARVAEALVAAARVAVGNTFINTTNLACRQTSRVDLHPLLTRHIVQACPRKPVLVPWLCSPT